MEEAITNNKRIAKNTFLLYIRTFVVMIVSIFTSRVILKALGVEDYGVYNVIGGMVAMFAVVSNSLAASISRFITFEIGRGNNVRLLQVFATSKVVLLVLAGIVLVLTEVVGVWFLSCKMQIPEGRMTAAMWVLQCSIVSFCVNLIAIPYYACIVAYEHMKAFAYFSLFEAILKLLICYLLMASPIDKLILYAILMMSISVLMRFLYNYYCRRHFKESRTSLSFHKPVFKEMFGFAGWSFFTSANSILSTQGCNMLINVYFGVTFNAARAIANQVQQAMTQFVSSFVTAINPQITKSYAAGEIDSMYSLVCRGARFSYYLTLIMVVPIFFEAETILNIWLTVVPDKAVVFTKLSLIYILMDGAGYTLYTANLATGRIKKYSLVLSSITFFVFPLSWVFFSKGASVEFTYIIALVANLLYHIARLFLTQDNVGLRAGYFAKKVYWPVFLTTFLSIIPSIFICRLFPPTVLRFIISMLIGVCMTASMALLVGMERQERRVIIDKTKSIASRALSKLNRI